MAPPQTAFACQSDVDPLSALLSQQSAEGWFETTNVINSLFTGRGMNAKAIEAALTKAVPTICRTRPRRHDLAGTVPVQGCLCGSGRPVEAVVPQSRPVAREDDWREGRGHRCGAGGDGREMTRTRFAATRSGSFRRVGKRSLLRGGTCIRDAPHAA